MTNYFQLSPQQQQQMMQAQSLAQPIPYNTPVNGWGSGLGQMVNSAMNGYDQYQGKRMMNGLFPQSQSQSPQLTAINQLSPNGSDAYKSQWLQNLGISTQPTQSPTSTTSPQPSQITQSPQSTAINQLSPNGSDAYKAQWLQNLGVK